MTGIEIAAISLAAAGTTMAAIGAVRQGQAAANAEKYNAQVAEQNKQIAEAQGAAASEAQKRESQRRIGAALAAYGASGVDVSSGSPVDILSESAREAELDAHTLRYNYRLKGLGFQNQAELARTSSSNYRTAGYFNAASTAVSGAADIAGMGVKFGK